MTDVTVPYGDNPTETAVLLLAAAEELGLDQNVVGTDSQAEGFVVPAEVAKKAKSSDSDKPAKKATAKKAAKKATAKKTAAKK